MTTPQRAAKEAVVEEVKERFGAVESAVFTEYRGLSVSDLAELRNALREAGGTYHVYKNTLVRRAVADLDLEVADLLTGPTAIVFVGEKPDGSQGDPVLVAKALQAFAKGHPHLIVKGGLLGADVIDEDGMKALATVAPREELLARFAGGLAAPMQKFAALLQTMPTNFAYGLKALIDAGGASGAPAPAAEEAAEAPAEEAPTEAAEEAAADTNDASEDAATEESANDSDEPAAQADDSTTEETTDSSPAEEADTNDEE